MRLRDPGPRSGGQAGATDGKGQGILLRRRCLEIRDLKPGEAITATLPLGELFDFKTPGEYTILASLPVLGNVDAVLTARPVKVRESSESLRLPTATAIARPRDARRESAAWAEDG